VEIASKNLTIPLEMHVSLGGSALHINTYAGPGDVDGTLTIIDMKRLVAEMVDSWLYYDDVESAQRDLEALLKVVEAQLSKVAKSRKRKKSR
jgi:hypothetical protein